MIAPRLLVRFRGVEYAIEQRGEAWAILVEEGAYFLTAGNDPDSAAVRFLNARMRNVLDRRRPALVASQRYPLLLLIDGVTVRAWPSFTPRNKGAKTYINPATGDRVAAMRDDLVWMLAARGRNPWVAGTVTAEQTVDDVVDLAKIWLTTGGRAGSS